MGYSYGWVRQLPDKRDRAYAFSIPPELSIPASVNLRPQSPGVFDQGQIGSCVGNGVSLRLWWNQVKAGGPKFIPSRLFIYYNARAMEGTVSEDAGCVIRDAVKSVADLGCAAEGRHTSGSWEYTQDFRKKPSKAAYNHAANHQAIVYRSVPQTPASIQACLAKGGPVIFGFSVYDSFESDAVAATGLVPFPKIDTESLLGGHCMLLMGYDQGTKLYDFQNSWGESWGDHGGGKIPFDYIHDADLASDFWTIEDQELGAVSG